MFGWLWSLRKTKLLWGDLKGRAKPINEPLLRPRVFHPRVNKIDEPPPHSAHPRSIYGQTRRFPLLLPDPHYWLFSISGKAAMWGFVTLAMAWRASVDIFVWQNAVYFLKRLFLVIRSSSGRAPYLHHENGRVLLWSKIWTVWKCSKFPRDYRFVIYSQGKRDAIISFYPYLDQASSVVQRPVVQLWQRSRTGIDNFSHCHQSSIQDCAR